MRKTITFLIPLCLMFCCHMRQSSSSDQEEKRDEYTRYAKGFQVSRHSDYILVDVNDPWKPDQILQRYILVDRSKSLPDNLPKGTIIRTPIQQIAVTTSVHCAALEELEAIDKIIGVCEPRFIRMPAIHNRIAKKLIVDIGDATSPNIETMADLETEVILVSPFQNAGYGAIEKLKIPIIECADYMENDPLGRAEWIRFFGLLTNREALADSLFSETEKQYQALKNKIASVKNRPTLLPGKKYGTSWYMPSENSYMAILYKDAGADYLFDYLSGNGSIPLTFENVLDKAIHADYWVFTYNLENDLTYTTLKEEFTPYESFDAFKNKKIYGCNTNASTFYEETSMHPDFLLQELSAIFHPSLFPDYQLKYFSPLQE